ncbi:MAG: ABC transporter permease [Acidimicrobiia bacterium]|nr:ABC transporter permease [Acidimicrobiia bacterium]MYC44011.1 ABC transporter permease [Acidimicrobiia bacterium]MYI20869.1 ABC transporter permease [Acidimicrobiia bacterium]
MNPPPEGRNEAAPEFVLPRHAEGFAKRLRRNLNPPLLWGAFIIFVLALGAYVVPAVWQFGAEIANPREALLPPSVRHPFGTDRSGFDIFVRVFHAPRIDLTIVVLGVGLGALIGIVLGVAAGFSRRLMGEASMRLADVVQAFPLLILAIALVSLGGNSLTNVVFVLAFVNAPVFLRLVRSRVLTVREQRYIQAAVALGNSTTRLVFRHVLPNSLGPAVVQFGVSMGYGILTLAGLAYLGVGVQVPTPEWGSMILGGASYITTGQWWISIFPGIFLAFAVFAFNLLSEGIEQAREVHLR